MCSKAFTHLRFLVPSEISILHISKLISWHNNKVTCLIFTIFYLTTEITKHKAPWIFFFKHAHSWRFNKIQHNRNPRFLQEIVVLQTALNPDIYYIRKAWEILNICSYKDIPHTSGFLQGNTEFSRQVPKLNHFSQERMILLDFKWSIHVYKHFSSP